MQTSKQRVYQGIILGAFIWALSLNSQAATILHSGANCQAANQAQANLMIWNKDGIQNNAPIDLFIICPVDIDFDEVTANQTDLFIFINIFMPPDYGNVGDPGPLCVARYVGTLINAASATNDVTGVVAVSQTIGTYQGNPGVTGFVGSTSLFLENFEAPPTGNPHAHLLCLLPKNGGTLQTYAGRLSD